MITLFTTPRPFEGYYAYLQTNALKSWSLLDPRAHRVIVYADEHNEGLEPFELASQLGFDTVSVEERTERGVPLLSFMFKDAQDRADETETIPCYVNADIIMSTNAVEAVHMAASCFPHGKYKKCLIVARRWNVQVLEYLDFEEGWWDELWYKVELQGSQSPECAIDLFAWKDDRADEEDGRVFPTFMPFAIGRYSWDNALVSAALGSGAAVVDITPVLKIIHQPHDNVPWHEPDADYNRTLTSSYNSLKDSTHTLTEEGLVGGWRG